MSSSEPFNKNKADPVNPLGLPPGSVRALVALTVVALFIMQSVRGQPAGLLLSEALLIVLAHYFASRRVLSVPPQLLGTLEAEGVLVREANPLWLPRNSVRFLILGAFAVMFGILLVRGELFQAETLDNLFLVFAYLVGTLVQYLRNRKPEMPIGRWRRLWLHLKALTVLLACLVIALLAWTGVLEVTPAWLQQVLLGWILFYFGSR